MRELSSLLSDLFNLTTVHLQLQSLSNAVSPSPIRTHA
uniref:Uncharacterized protein n=1 Tax=Anguilla anguilla TaxID=7936 RepID=A0A0E9WLI1_ANGAN